MLKKQLVGAEKSLQLSLKGLYFWLQMLRSTALWKENFKSVVFEENSKFSLELYSIYFNLGVKVEE